MTGVPQEYHTGRPLAEGLLQQIDGMLLVAQRQRNAAQVEWGNVPLFGELLELSQKPQALVPLSLMSVSACQHS